MAVKELLFLLFPNYVQFGVHTELSKKKIKKIEPLLSISSNQGL